MDPSFRTLKLEEKLKRVESKKHHHKEEATAIFKDDNWNGEIWDHNDKNSDTGGIQTSEALLVCFR
jgi:hypothetical protein